MLTAMLMHSGCETKDAPSSPTSKIDQACGSLCDNGRFKKFSGQAIHLEVESPGEEAQVFYNVDPSQLMTQAISLNKIVRISGFALPANMVPAATTDSSNHDKPDAFADILAIPTVNRISFLSPRIPTMKSRLQTDAGFAIDLLAGLSYTLILNPAGEKGRAPIHLNAGVITSDNHLDFVMNSNPHKLTGRVVFDETSFTDSNVRPRMRARLMLGSRLVSSVNEIDAVGVFSLEVSKPLFKDAENQPLNLIVEPLDEETALPRIKHKLDLEMINTDFEVGDINVGTLKKPIAVTFDVHGRDDSPISDAMLFLRAPIGAGTAVVKKQANKSGSTKFTHLYEGKYDVAVIPPVDSQYAMRVIKNVDFDSQQSIQISIDLDKREGLIAHVLSPLGQKVSGAQIQFSRIGELGNFATEDIYDDNLFKLIASTNDEGRICNRKFGFNTADKNQCTALLLDDGTYLAHIIPPAGTELAHKWITFNFPEKNELSITLDQPEILAGQILKPDGKSAAANAYVTVYLAETNMHNQPKMIGNAITDQNGFFRALVSAP